MAYGDNSLAEDQPLDSPHASKNGGRQTIDPKLEAIKARVKEREEEIEKIKQIQAEEKQLMARCSPTGTTAIVHVPLSLEERKAIDDRSIYVGNVDYGATAAALEAHFLGCGSVNRVTILSNKSNGRPKGCAYIEFGSKEFLDTALAMNETKFCGRLLKVMSKRTNQPGISTTDRFPRGFPGRGRGGSRGGSRGSPCCHGSFRGTRRPIGHQGHSKYYAPY